MRLEHVKTSAPGYEGLEEASRVKNMNFAELESWIAELRSRVAKLSLSAKYAETYSSTFAAQVEAKLEKPSRMIKLTMEEEARVNATLQQFDYMMPTAALGTAELLKKYIADPAHWMENREAM